MNDAISLAILFECLEAMRNAQEQLLLSNHTSSSPEYQAASRLAKARGTLIGRLTVIVPDLPVECVQ